MKQPQKDIIIFGSYILGFSFIAIWITITSDFESGIIVGVILGIGVLLCVGLCFIISPSHYYPSVEDEKK